MIPNIALLVHSFCFQTIQKGFRDSQFEIEILSNESVTAENLNFHIPLNL